MIERSSPALFICPCCTLPTLSERSSWQICVICWWEDDGQDDARADQIWGGPNGKYSLTAARANFISHGHMYSAGSGIDLVEHPMQQRVVLLDYARAILAGKQLLDETRLRNLIKAEREARDALD